MNNLSLDTAIRLGAVGYPQDTSTFVWVKTENKWHYCTRTVNGVRTFYGERVELIIPHQNIEEIVDSPDVEDILDRLPKKLDNYEYLQCIPCGDGWCVYYGDCPSDPNLDTEANTLTEAVAEMYIYLASHSLL